MTNFYSIQPVDTIVDECVKRAPQDVADWRKNHPTKSSKKSESSSKNETCPNPENKAIPKCIRHEIIANCPDWVKSSECDGLMSFVKTCRDYPPRGNCGKKSNKMDSEAKKEKKN